MAEEDQYTFGKKATEQLAKTVREVSRRMMNETQTRARWHFHGGSGGGGQIIWFTVVSMNCEVTPWILTVEVTDYSGGCTAAIPGEDSYGRVEVENFCNIANYFTDVTIVGKSGSAAYGYPRTGECTGRFILTDICGSGDCA